jgi:CDP-6-deoxy-D-xylo-4-hexulose-3-dehydrase
MGRVQLKKIKSIKESRKKNFDFLYKHLSKYPKLIMPKWVKGADVCWFAFPLSVDTDRGSLVSHLEKNGIETRSMFSGNIIRHPAYANSTYKISGTLTEADFILKNSFWITCHPRLTKEDLEFIVSVFDSYFNA